MGARREYRFSWWHQGVFVFDRGYEWSEDAEEYVEATGIGALCGQSRSRGVVYLSPGEAAFGADDARLVVETLDAPPPIADAATSVCEFDLDVTTGAVVLEESGGGGSETVVEIPPGRWRCRWSGFGEEALQTWEDLDESARGERPDCYELQLWPREGDSELQIVRGV